MILPPSQLARRIAGSDYCWPQVQYQKKVAPGVFAFSCAGHGGMVGILPAMKNVPANLLTAARSTGKITPYVVMRDGRGKTQIHPRYVLEMDANVAIFDDWKSRFEVDEIDVWIGEEDCDWATLAAIPSVAEGMIRSGYATGTVETLDVVGCLSRWNEDFAKVAGIV